MPSKPKNNIPLQPGRLRRSPDERKHVCLQCADGFITTSPHAKFCSIKCRQVYRRSNRPLSADQTEKARVRARAWYAENKVRAVSNVASWQGNNPDKAVAYKKKWADENKDYVKARVANRRAIIKSRPGKVTRERIRDLMALQSGKCICCRVKLSDYHVDHIMPLALGGDNTSENLQLLCPPCNLDKRAKHPVDFMQQRGFLL